MKNIIIDCRMREIEKELFKSLGYNLIELQMSENVYAEISSHVDIFVAKIGDSVVVEKTRYDDVKSQIKDRDIVCRE